MALGRQMAAGGAEAEVERQPTQPRLHQRDIAAAIRAGIRREMLAAEPVATRAALHHRVLIPVVVASRRVALRRDEKWRRLTHGEPGLSFVVVRRGSSCLVVVFGCMQAARRHPSASFPQCKSYASHSYETFARVRQPKATFITAARAIRCHHLEYDGNLPILSGWIGRGNLPRRRATELHQGECHAM